MSRIMTEGEIRALVQEYIQLRLKEELDDVSCSGSDLMYTDSRLCEIDNLFSEETVLALEAAVAYIIEGTPTFASGAPNPDYYQNKEVR